MLLVNNESLASVPRTFVSSLPSQLGTGREKESVQGRMEADNPNPNAISNLVSLTSAQGTCRPVEELPRNFVDAIATSSQPIFLDLMKA
jgi:hypothetical protein